MSAEFRTWWAAGRALRPGTVSGVAPGLTVPREPGGRLGFGVCRQCGVPSACGCSKPHSAPLKPSFRVRLLTPSHREKLRLRQVVQLGLAQDVGLGGHTPPPAPWFLYSTVLQPTASPEVDWPETHLFLSSSFCLFLTIFFLKHDILIEMFTKH